MARFSSSEGKQKLLQLKKKKKSLAEVVNEQLSGQRQEGASYEEGGMVEELDFSSDNEGEENERDWDSGVHSRRAAVPGGKRARGADASGLRKRGPLDASLSEGKYAATPVNVEAAMDDIFGTLDMGDMDAEGEEFYDDEDDEDFQGHSDDEDDDEEEEEGPSSARRRKAKDLSEEEYMEWLERKRKKQGSSRKLSSLAVMNDDVARNAEEDEILGQLEDLRQAQMQLVGSGAAESAEDMDGDEPAATARARQLEHDAKKTQSVVRHYILIYSQLLRLRVRLQPAVTKAISMPQYYALPQFFKKSAALEAAARGQGAPTDATEEDGLSSEDLRRTRLQLQKTMNDVKSQLRRTLGTLYQAATHDAEGRGASSSSAASPVSKKRRLDKGADGNEEHDESDDDVAIPDVSFDQIQRYHSRARHAANDCLDYWGSKLVQANSAKLKTIAQPLPQQIASILSSMTRLRAKVQKNRSHLTILSHPEHVLAATSADVKAKRAIHIAEGDVDREIFDDSDFLHELVRRGGAVANQLERQVAEMKKELLPQKDGARKGFHRMTKGKAVSYEPRPKLVGFMAAENFDHTERNDVVVKSLFQ